MKFTLCEGFSLPNSRSVYATKSVKDALSYISNQGIVLRILYDKQFNYIFIQNAEAGVHMDILKDAFNSGIYTFPFKYSPEDPDEDMEYVVNNKFEIYNYFDDLQEDGGIQCIMYVPKGFEDEEAYIRNDGYDKEYKFGKLGTFYTRDVPEDKFIFKEELNK